MSRGQHRNKSHTAKRAAYNERKQRTDYKKGGMNIVPNKPYKGIA